MPVFRGVYSAVRADDQPVSFEFSVEARDHVHATDLVSQQAEELCKERPYFPVLRFDGGPRTFDLSEAGELAVTEAAEEREI